MHERRLSRPVVTDDADALAGEKQKIGAIQSPDGAIGFFDPDEIDERNARVSAWSRLLAARALGSQAYFSLALIAATASACVYSWLATPPFGICGNSFSKSSWVKAR